MKRALILVDHGSRLAEANQVLEDVAAMVRGLTTDAVYTAHMELAAPTIAEAFEAAVAAGADHVFIFPYFLAPGRHSRQDIPRMCAEAAARHAGIRWCCGGPIGPDRALGELIVRRVEQCPAEEYR